MRLLEFLLGLVIAAATLWDVFTTVLVPGRPPGWRGIAGLVLAGALPIWRRTRSTGNVRYHHVLFAPVLLLLAFLSWMLLLLAGFGLMIHAVGTLFEPPLNSFAQALYVAGCSIMTLGVSEVDAHGPARWIIVAASFAGMTTVTVTVTFILQIQSALQHRETAVLALSVVSGSSGTGIRLLETYADLKVTGDLQLLFQSWSDWSAAVLHSHAAHPILSYFRSADVESDWPAALSVVLDAATLVSVFTTDAASGSATLMHRSGSRTASRLAAIYHLEEPSLPAEPAQTAWVLRDRLEHAGYPLRNDPEATARFDKMRGDYAGRLAALADHFGARPVPLLPEPHVERGSP